MGYFYAAMWLIIGLVLIFSLSKENKVFYFAGGFFVLLGAWWLADSLFPDSGFFTGAWGAALRIVTLAALVILSIAFFLERQRNIKKEMQEKKEESPRAERDEPRAGVGGVNLMRPQEDDEEEKEEEE